MCTTTRERKVYELYNYTIGRNYLMKVGAMQVLCLRRTSIEKKKLINYAFFDRARTQVLNYGTQ
jgi:hypothetical protein